MAVPPPASSFLTTFDLDEAVDDAVDTGADGSSKRATPEQLIDGIWTVFAGDGEDPGSRASWGKLGVRDKDPGRRVDLPHRFHRLAAAAPPSRRRAGIR